MKMDNINIDIEMDGETNNFYFKKSGDFEYVYDGITICVEHVNKLEGRKIVVEQCPERLEKYKDIILAAFETKYDRKIKEYQNDYESGFEETSDDDNDNYDIKVPYDPDLITVAPAKFSLKEIVGMIDGDEDEEPVLDLSPDFQRDYVWDSVRKSRLIESILLNIPLPVFYFARDKEGKMQVVDGVQRLTTIYKFFKNEFKLNNLEYLKKECDGKYFKNGKKDEEESLRPKLVRALRTYQIDCNIIEPSTPENVKLDIFKRLNTGGKELNKQEVRHAFMKKNVRDFIKKLVELKEFQEATDYGINDKRMMAQELIMRYIGFYCQNNNRFINVDYNGKMDEFIDNVAVQLNECKKIPYDEIENEFKSVMCKSKIMFGKKAFRKIDVDNNDNVIDKKNPINKSLFITFSILLSKYSIEKIKKGGNIEKEFAKFLKSDEDFFNSISHNTNYLLKSQAMKSISIFLKSLYGE